jgi:hypothetical protein
LLLNADYPQGSLNSQKVQRVMDNPLYWAFCWASGQVLAEFLLAYPHWVAGKRVLDFGCGSGVVADSRVKNFDYPPYRQIARRNCFTVPDLAESAEFRDVRTYLAE